MSLRMTENDSNERKASLKPNKSNRRLIAFIIAIEVIIFSFSFYISYRKIVEFRGQRIFADILRSSWSGTTKFDSKENDENDKQIQIYNSISKMINNDNALTGFLSPSLRSFFKYQKGVIIYQNEHEGVKLPEILKNDNPQKAKFFQFDLGNNGLKIDFMVGKIDDSYPGIKSDNSGMDMKIPNEGTFTYGNIFIDNHYCPEISLKDILQKPLKIVPSGKGPIALIYHTHTSEAYCKVIEDRTDLKGSVTVNQALNVVKPGDDIYNVLKGKYRINAIHNTTVHDKGLDQNIAYDLSKKTVNDILSKNSEIKLGIDIHRDAVASGTTRFSKTVKDSDGKSYSQVMFVVATDFTNTNPRWEDNFKLALLMIDKMETKVKGISRGITLRKDPYNQNITENSLLIELGFDGDLIDQADQTANLIGDILGEIYTIS